MLTMNESTTNSICTHHKNVYISMKTSEGTVPTFNSCTKCAGSPGIIHDRTPDCNPLKTSQLNVALIHKLRWPTLAYLFDMMYTGFCSTGHWQTSGRLGQELNVCTV